MKKQPIITAFLVAACFAFNFYSCGNSSSASNETEGKAEAAATTVTESFEAEFLGTYIYAGPDTISTPKCTDTLSVWRAIVDCIGTSNIMGDIKVHFDFCGNENGYYGNTFAYMVDQSNDTLFIKSLEGQVKQGKTEEHPSFVTSYWRDDFEILGGTGKYKGALGGGKTDDYNSSEDSNSHHFWKGTITLNKEAD